MWNYSRLFRAVCAIGVALVCLWPTATQAAPAQATVDWIQPQSAAQSYRKASDPAVLEFPRDFGAHPEFQTEWWYYTGNLQSQTGHKFGYQFTIFRRAVDPTIPNSEGTDWRTNQIYFAHFTVSDIDDQHFYPQEQFSRGSANLAGAQAEPYQIWINDWSISGDGDLVHLKAAGDQVAIDLDLQQTRPPVLQGDRGLSIKGPEPGNASYYYSIVQQPTTGTVTIQDDTFSVAGTSWKDHEYSTSALSPGTAGWDWFSLQFEDQTALMMFVLRQDDQTPLEFSKGAFIDQDGKITPLSAEDWQLQVLKQWTSPQSKATYPAAWQLEIPKLELNVKGEPLMANQELNLSTVYWEGAVSFTGTRQELPVNAQGYVELTGYKESLTSMN